MEVNVLFLERPPRQRLVNLKTQWLTSALTPWALITCEWCQGTRNVSSYKRVETQMSMTVVGCVDCPIALVTHTHACRHARTHTPQSRRLSMCRRSTVFPPQREWMQLLRTRLLLPLLCQEPRAALHSSLIRSQIYLERWQRLKKAARHPTWLED